MELNYQGPDVGTQNRRQSCRKAGSWCVAVVYIAQLGQVHVFAAPIVTHFEPRDHSKPGVGRPPSVAKAGRAEPRETGMTRLAATHRLCSSPRFWALSPTFARPSRT